MVSVKFFGTLIIILLIVGFSIFTLMRATNPVRVLVNQEDYITKGNISLIEIGTYTSESTKNNLNLTKRLVSNYSIKYKYYNFGGDDLNLLYSEAMGCGSDLGDWQTLHELIITKQPKSNSEIYALFKDKGIDIEDLQKCLEIDRPFEIKIKDNNEKISKIDLPTIPAYIINGKVYTGSMTFESVSRAISQSKDL